MKTNQVISVSPCSKCSNHIQGLSKDCQECYYCTDRSVYVAAQYDPPWEGYGRAYSEAVFSSLNEALVPLFVAR